MKIKIIITVVLFPLLSGAQHLNKFGHFENTLNEKLLFRTIQTKQGMVVEKDGLQLKGNTAFKIPQGYVTLSGEYENTSSTLRVFNNNGEETFNKTFAQTINFILSPSGKYCAFQDRTYIHTVDLSNNKINSFSGSNVFSINDLGLVAYFNQNNSTINYRTIKIQVSEPVYRVIFFNNEPLFITRKNILHMKGKTHENVFTATEGRIFDLKVIGNKLYFSTKNEVGGEFIFHSFSTINLIDFKSEEETRLKLSEPRTGFLQRNSNSINNTNTLTNETILNPIYYYVDTVYQPIGNSYAEMQEYTIGDPYPHPGVDLLGTYLQEVRSVKKGYVKAVLTTSGQYHWRIAISNLNTSNLSQGYLYAHLEETTIPYLPGDSVNESDIVGLLVDFPVQDFVHCHFARIVDSGIVWNADWWTFDNPLSYMTNFFDSIPPTFEKTISNDAFAFRDLNGNYLSPDSLYGSVKVISKVFDQINAGWHVDVNTVRYSVSPLAAPQIMLLDSFSYEYNFYSDSYFGGAYYPGLLNTIYSRDVNCYSTADYNVRDFFHIVTNSDGNDTIDGNDSLQFFNTLSLPDSSYIFRVTASDPYGNAATDSMIIRIKNTATYAENLSAERIVKIFPNPSGNGIFKILSNNKDLINCNIYSATGKKIISSQFYSHQVIDLSNYESGIYIAAINTNTKTIFAKLTKL